jgi:hypothetical protein
MRHIRSDTKMLVVGIVIGVGAMLAKGAADVPSPRYQISSWSTAIPTDIRHGAYVVDSQTGIVVSYVNENTGVKLRSP